MSRLSLPKALVLCSLLFSAARGQDPPPLAGERPLLRIEAGGPAGYVTSLVFSPNGDVLYAAGSDKVVRVWVRESGSGRFVLDERAAYRVPIGPGPEGLINALALSDDGLWLAVAGYAAPRVAAGFAAGFRAPGEVLPVEQKPEAMWLDEGTIYVFDTRTAEARALRGHLGPVLSLAFAPSRANKPPLLVSAGEDWSAAQRSMVGSARVWDVQQSRQLTGMQLPRPTAGRPGLALVHLGDQPAAVGVGLAWGDGQFRFWDAERRTLVSQQDDQQATSIAFLPQQRRYFTGGAGQLRSWELLTAQRTLRAASPIRVSADRESFIWGLQPLASRPAGPLDRAAMISVRRANPGQLQYRMQIVGLDSAARQALSPDTALWSMPESAAMQPVIGVSPSGDRLAVSGGPAHEILVFTIPDLLRGAAEPQRLRSAGLELGYVAFAQRGNDWGLMLSQYGKALPGELPREPRRGDWVFDLSVGRRSDNLSGWTVSIPQQENWQVDLDQTAADKPVLAVRERGRIVGRIEIEPAAQVSDYALLPNGRLLATAVFIHGRPELRLYDIDGGRQVRQLTGPVERISSLSVSADGQRIAAAADDRTVSIWSLADLPRDTIAGTDERKPLLTLFFVQSESGEPGWIGWNPQGPFESSDRQVERYLGWHFNLYQPGTPARFARADQYRADYFRPGLVRALVERGEVPVAPPMPEPMMSLQIREPLRTHSADGPADVLVRSNRLAMDFAAFPYEPVYVEQVTWEAGAGPQPMTWNAEHRHWTADLSSLNLRRGHHHLRVSLRTREEPPQAFTRELTLRFQPSPPEVASRLPAQGPPVDAAQFGFQAEVLTAGESAHARLVHRHGSQTIAELDLGDERRIDAPISLRPGSNSIEIIARNRDALRGFEDDETSRSTWLVTYNPRPVPPPVISLKSIAPLLDGEDGREPRQIELGRTIEVAVRRIRVIGEIGAAEELESAEITPPGAGRSRPLSGFQPATIKTLAISEDFDLLPGSQTISVTAKTPNSVPAEQPLTVFYRPPLPRITLLEPVDQGTVYEGEQPPLLPLTALIAAPQDHEPVTAAVLVNRNELPDPPKIDRQSGRLTATVPLQPGDNRIEVRLSNGWGEAHSQAVHVRYLRPPRIVDVQQPRVETQPLIDVIYWAESPADLPVTEAAVNGRVIPPESITQEQGRWKITARGVPLSDGVNELQLQAFNRDGPAREAGSLRVAFKASRPPPQITLAENEQSVSTQKYRVRFSARSSSPLTLIELLRQEKVLYRTTDPATLAADPQGWITLPEVQLHRGVNRLRLHAGNEWAKSDPVEVIVSHVPQPVRLVVDSLEPVSRPGTRINASPVSNGLLHFAAAAEADVWLHGRVVWPQDADQAVDQEHAGRIWVNGFQQLSRIVLEPRDGQQLARRFKTRLLLNRAENQVDLKLDGLPLDADDRLQFFVDCQAPRADQTLHLLIIGIGEENEAALEQRAERALQIETNPRGQRQKPGFGRVIKYACLTGAVSPGHIGFQLKRIHDVIRQSASGRAGPTNDVVVLYYQGPEVLNKEGRIALATSFPSPQRASIEGNVLTRFVDNSPGAHLLLLDVARLGKMPPAGQVFWDPDSHLGVLRYAWLRGADTPSDARLLTALLTAVERARPQGGRLIDIESEVAREFAQARQRHPGALAYDKHLPASMRDLVLGGTR